MAVLSCESHLTVGEQNEQVRGSPLCTQGPNWIPGKYVIPHSTKEKAEEGGVGVPRSQTKRGS